MICALSQIYRSTTLAYDWIYYYFLFDQDTKTTTTTFYCYKSKVKFDYCFFNVKVENKTSSFAAQPSSKKTLLIIWWLDFQLLYLTIERFVWLLDSYLDQFLTGCCNVDVLLPVVELSHDRINALVFQCLPAGFGRCQLHKRQTVKELNMKTCLCECVRLRVCLLCRTSKSVSSSIFLMSASSSLFLSSGRYCRSTGRPEHHINFCQNPHQRYCGWA